MSGSPDVFIVLAGIDYEGTDIKGCFPTEASAIEWMRHEVTSVDGTLCHFDYVKVVQFQVGNLKHGDPQSGFVECCERWSNGYEGWMLGSED